MRPPHTSGVHFKVWLLTTSVNCPSLPVLNIPDHIQGHIDKIVMSTLVLLYYFDLNGTLWMRNLVYIFCQCIIPEQRCTLFVKQRNMCHLLNKLTDCLFVHHTWTLLTQTLNQTLKALNFSTITYNSMCVVLDDFKNFKLPNQLLCCQGHSELMVRCWINTSFVNKKSSFNHFLMKYPNELAPNLNSKINFVCLSVELLLSLVSYSR